MNVLSPAITGDLVTENEAASILVVSTRTLQAWRLRGGGPAYVKLGKAVRYSRAELSRFVAERTRAHTSDRGAAA